MTDETKGKASAKGSDDASGAKGDPGKAAAEAKSAAKSAAGKARKEAGAVAQEAKQAASDVTAQAKKAARDVAGTAQGELKGAIEEQKSAGAERAQRIAGAIDRAGDELAEEIPFAGDVMHRAAQEIETVATAVRERDPRELLDVAQDFARRQPALFAGAVGLLGFAAVRFVMASPRAGDDAVTVGGSAPAGPGSGPEGKALEATGVQGTRTTASGDPGGASPAAPGFGEGNTEPEGKA